MVGPLALAVVRGRVATGAGAISSTSQPTAGTTSLRLLQGTGIAVLPRYFVARDIAARRLKQLLPRVELHRNSFRLVGRTGHPRENKLRALAADLAAIPLR